MINFAKIMVGIAFIGVGLFIGTVIALYIS